MDRQKLIADLISDEGLKLFPYICPSGKNTVGVGKNIDDNPLTLTELIYLGIKERKPEDVLNKLKQSGITKGDAIYLLENDIENVEKQLINNFSWYEAAPEEVQRAIANLCFNIGISRLLQFKNTLLFLKRKQYEEASVEILKSKWSTQVGLRSKRISELIKQAK